MRNGEYTLVVAPPDYPGMRYRGRYCYEHHLVWWQHTGETLRRGEVVHHRDGVKTNNVFANLEKHTVGDHVRHHARPPQMISVTCWWCHAPYEMMLRDYKSRAKEVGHTNFCCSRSCQVRKQQYDRKNIPR